VTCIIYYGTLDRFSRVNLFAGSIPAPASFQLDKAGKKHFYKCEQCGEMVDMRQLDDVLFHEDHVHRPDIQYGGSEEL
jgi:hypothetical protein